MAIKLDGATKENYVWGLRVGFVTYGASFKGDSKQAYDALERKTAGAVRGSISNASHLSQELEVKRVLADPKYNDAWEPYPFNSGYFMCLRIKTVEAEKLRVHLLDKYGVGLISLGDTDLRVAFSCLEKDDVRELFDTVLQGINDLT